MEKIDAFARASRALGVSAVFLRIAFSDDDTELQINMPLLQMVADMGALRDGSPAADIMPEIVLEADDVVFKHTRPGPFTSSGLHELLRDRGVTNIAIAGVATNASVEAAVRQAADLGYQTAVLSDLCSASDEASHRASLSSMAQFARVTESSDFLASLA